MGRGLEFEQFARDILERSPGIELTASPGRYGPDYGLAFMASRNGRPPALLGKKPEKKTACYCTYGADAGG